MEATYIGSKYMKWEIDGKSGEFTEIFLVKPFRMDEKDYVGERVAIEKVRTDLRDKLKAFAPGCTVKLSYDSDAKNRAILVGIDNP